MQQEVTLTERTERKEEQSRSRATGADRSPTDAPPEKFRRLYDGEKKRTKTQKGAAAEAGGNLEVPYIQQRREAGVASSHQESTHASY